MGTPVRGNAGDAPALDRSIEDRSEGRVSREGNGIPQRNGSARALRTAVSAMWRADPAHSLCGQRDELLCAMSDGRSCAGGSQPVAAAGEGLAAHPGLVGEHDPSRARRWRANVLNQRCSRIVSIQRNTTVLVGKLLGLYG